MSILEQRKIEEYAGGSVPEALLGTAGVLMQKTNHGGGSPFLRGLTGQQTLILVDGIRLNNMTFRSGPNQYLNTFDPFTVQRIEVVRGSGSVQNGSDALGGVVQIITKAPRFSQENKLSALAFGKILSQNMEQSGGGQLNYSSNRFAILGDFAIRQFGDIVAGGNLGKLSPSGYSQFSGNFKSRFRIRDHALLTMSYQQLNQNEVPLFHRVALEDFKFFNFSVQNRQLAYTKLDLHYNSRFLKAIQLTTSLNVSEEGRESQRNNSDNIVNERDKVNSFSFNGTIYSEPFNFWKINSGFEIYHDKVGSKRITENSVTRESVQQRALYPDGSGVDGYGRSFWTSIRFNINNNDS